MKQQLIKDYFSVPKGTYVDVYLRGTDGYNIHVSRSKDCFAVFNEQQKKEYIGYLTQ